MRTGCIGGRSAFKLSRRFFITLYLPRDSYWDASGFALWGNDDDLRTHHIAPAVCSIEPCRGLQAYHVWFPPSTSPSLEAPLHHRLHADLLQKDVILVDMAQHFVALRCKETSSAAVHSREVFCKAQNRRTISSFHRARLLHRRFRTPQTTSVVFIATVPQGGQPSNRTLLHRVKNVLGPLYNVKKCLPAKFEKLPGNFSFTNISG